MGAARDEALHQKRPSAQGAALQHEKVAAMQSMSHSLRSSGRVSTPRLSPRVHLLHHKKHQEQYQLN